MKIFSFLNPAEAEILVLQNENVNVRDCRCGKRGKYQEIPNK